MLQQGRRAIAIRRMPIVRNERLKVLVCRPHRGELRPGSEAALGGAEAIQPDILLGLLAELVHERLLGEAGAADSGQVLAKAERAIDEQPRKHLIGISGPVTAPMQQNFSGASISAEASDRLAQGSGHRGPAHDQGKGPAEGRRQVTREHLEAMDGTGITCASTGTPARDRRCA